LRQFNSQSEMTITADRFCFAFFGFVSGVQHEEPYLSIDASMVLRSARVALRGIVISQIINRQSEVVVCGASSMV
jgi:hypothetical protein